MRHQFLVIAAVCAMFVGCAAEPERPALAPEPETPATTSDVIPDMIVAERGGIAPEGVEYDTTNNRFLMGSASEGSIFQIHNDGRVTTVVSDPDLVGSMGIEVDELRDRLLVVGRVQAELGVYNLTTGERIAMVDLAAAIADPPGDAMYFANDVAVGDDGTAYVTDSRMSVIYRVGMDYQASVFHRSEAWFNGIVHHPSGYLLVADGNPGPTLWRVPLDDPGNNTTQVTLPEEIPAPDGMVWTADGRLAIVSGADNRVVALTSEDDWATAQVAGVAPYETLATTAAAVGDDIYVIHPNFAAAEPLNFAKADPPSLERVVFR